MAEKKIYTQYPFEGLSLEKRETLERWLGEAGIEIYPSERVFGNVSSDVFDRPLSITSSSQKDSDFTIDLAVRFSNLGMDVRPHLAARNIEEDALEGYLARLDDAGIRKLIVVGGDNEIPKGTYASSDDLLKAIAAVGYIPEEIDVSGYPEGHPFIPDDVLDKSLLKKQAFSEWYGIEMKIVTQACFDVSNLENWISGIREKGVTMPVMVGVPGPMKLDNLGSFLKATRIANSKIILEKLLSGQRDSELSIIRYEPEELVADIADKLSGKVAGLHFYSFNAVQTNLKLITQMQKQLNPSR